MTKKVLVLLSDGKELLAAYGNYSSDKLRNFNRKNDVYTVGFAWTTRSWQG
ncbi:MAG: hypothetical protein V8S34_06375 [Lawsonibacter sp.]